MIIVALLKGVPARTTKVVRNDNILQREVMNMALNPNDVKALEAAGFLRRRVGGKIVGLTMGPEVRLRSVVQPLYRSEVTGIDEAFIVSDPKMAGSDTVATSYAISLGVLKVLERHTAPIDELIRAIKAESQVEMLDADAMRLYTENVLSNRVYSEGPAKDQSITGRFSRGELTPEKAIALLESEKEIVSKFVVVAGIRASDGETGSVGPQVAEALAEEMHLDFPHATYVEDLDVDGGSLKIQAGRRIGRSMQELEMDCPCLITLAPEYRARSSNPLNSILAFENSYRGKILEPAKWNADDIYADHSKLGFYGSVVIVGPAVQLGKPPTQKVLDRSMVFVKRVERIVRDGKEYGPFEKGDLADALPPALQLDLVSRGDITGFSLEKLREEIFT